MQQRQADTSQPPRVEAGYVFPAERIVITTEAQRRLHGHCDIPSERYGDRVDPTFLARRPILLNTQTMAVCHPENGKVHTVHRIRLHEPVALGEPVTMTGGFIALSDVSRGWVAHSRWHYRREDGAEVLTVEPEVMMIDPDRAPTKKKPARATPAASGAAEDGFDLLLRKQCTPESTLGYCEGSENLIHLDPDYAKGFGFRAPIIAGNQTVNFLLEALALDGAPTALDVEIRFLRPVFWDDAIDVHGQSTHAGGPLQEIKAVNGESRVVATCSVRSVLYDA